HMQLALADALPADGVEVVAVDHAAQLALAGGLVAVDVVQRAARIETGVEAQLDPARQALAQAQAGAGCAPVPVGRRVAWPRRSWRRAGRQRAATGAGAPH